MPIIEAKVLRYSMVSYLIISIFFIVYFIRNLKISDVYEMYCESLYCEWRIL